MLSDELHALLFGMPTSAPDWMRRFAQTVKRHADWQHSCHEAIAGEYARNAAARDGNARVGWYLLSQDEAEDALRWFEADAHEGRAGWWLGLRHAEALAALDRLAEAERQVERIYSEHAEARNGHASIAWSLRERLGAGAALDRVRMDEAAGRLTIGFALNHAVLLGGTGRWSEAVAMVEQAYAQQADLQDGHARLGAIESERQDWSRACAWAELDLNLQRMSAPWKLTVARWFAKAGRRDDAISLVEAAYDADPGLNDGFAQLGWVLAEEEAPDDAWTLAERDLVLGRMSPRWKARIARLPALKGDWHAAVSLVEAACCERPALVDGFASLGVLAFDGGDAIRGLALMDRDASALRLSGPRRKDWLLLKGRLSGASDPGSVAGLVAMLEAAIFGLDRTSGVTELRERLSSLKDAVADLGDAIPEKLRRLLASLNALLGRHERHAASILVGAVHLLEPQRKWRRRGLFDASLNWLVSYGERLEQALLDWQEAGRCFPAITEDDKTEALHGALKIEERMLGRPCGVVGDRLAQYGAVVQLAREGAGRLRILELGTLFGSSCMQFLLAGQRLGVDVQVTCVDPLDGYYGHDRDPVSGAPVSVDTLLRNLERMELPAAAVELRQYRSACPEARRGLRPESIDLLLIDADHSHEGVLADWQNYCGLVRPGGMVIFDDYGPVHPGVVSAVDSICGSAPDWSRMGCLGTSFILRRH